MKGYRWQIYIPVGIIFYNAQKGPWQYPLAVYG
jgi:hypothetical protein